jgi:hypothetical protein
MKDLVKEVIKVHYNEIAKADAKIEIRPYKGKRDFNQIYNVI